MNPSTTLNRQIRLASRPSGLPAISDFQMDYSMLPSPAPSEVLVRSVYLSLDPWLRGRMNEGATAQSVAIGDVMPGLAVGFVMESNDSTFRVGDAVEGMLGWQEYAVADGRDLRKVDTALAPISTALGVLGLEQGGYDEYGQPLEAKPEISLYTHDTFVDLCRGPHVADTAQINPDSIKLLNIAGAYWRGD